MAKKKYEEAVENYKSAIKKLYENLNSFEDKYEDFLDFSAKMYKMPFADAIVLFNQNPDITKAAELKVWNKLGRKVKRGEKAVFVPDENGKIKFYYDVSQTVGRPLPKLWTVNRDTADQLRDYYTNEYGRSFEDFNYVLDKLSYDEVDYYSDDIADNIREKYSLSDEDVEAYIHEMVTAVRRTVAARCSLDNDGKLMVGTRPFALQASLISSPEMFADFLANVNTYAKETINEIYEAVKYVKKGSRSETRLHEMISAAVEGENIEPELPLPDVNNTVVVANGSATAEENVPPFSDDVIAVVVDDVFTDLFWQYHHDNNYPTAEKFLADYLGCDSYIEREEAIAKFVLGSERLTSNSVIDGIEYQYHVTDNGIMIVQNDSDTLTHEMLCNWDTITGLVSDKLRSGEYVPQSVKEENKTFIIERTPEVLESLATKENPQELYEEFFNSIGFHMNPEYNAAPTDMNEEMILGILQYDNFLGRSALDINDYYIQSESMADKTEYIRNAYQKELNTSIQFHVNGIECGYTAYKDGLHIWQGSSSNNTAHTAFTWEQLAEYVDELVQNGEYLAPNRYSDNEEESEPIFAPKKNTKRAKSAPVPDNQLSFFNLSAAESEEINIETAQNIEVPTLSPGKDISIPQEVIDHVLRDGGMERNSVSRIIFLFSRTDDLTEKVDFLRQELAEENYGESRGYLIPDDTLAVGVRKYSTWYTSEGLVIAANESIDRAGGAGRKVVSYEEMAERITELLDNGLYATQQAIDTADYFIIDALADRIRAFGWDNDNEKRPFFLDDSVVGGTAPDAEKRVAELLSDPNSLNELIQGFEAFAEDYANGSAELRWHYRSRYSVEYTLENTKRLALPKKAFKASEELPKKPGYFVSEDQKENLLFRRGQYVRGKFSIDEYFEEHKGKTERAKFLNNFYGIGGGTVTGTSDEWHDSKGFGYAYGDNVSAYGTGGLASTLMKWTEVADIIERLRSSDRYITQQEIDNSILDVKREIERYNPDKADSYESAVYENNKKWLKKWEPKGTEYKAKAETAEQEQTAEIVTPEQSELITSEIKKEITRLSREYPALFGTEQKQKIPNTIEHRNFVNMQKMFPDMFSRKHSYERYGCDEDSGYEPLTVEWITPTRLSISHTYTQLGDLMYDPMIDYEIDFEKQTANAIMYEQSSMGIYQEYANGSKGQRDTNSFTKTWLSNIKEQSSARYLERATVEHEYNGDAFTIQLNYDLDGQLVSVNGDDEAVADYYAKNNIEPSEIAAVPDNEVNVGAVGEYDGETVVVQSINEEQGTAELVLTDHEAEIVQEISAEELEENFNEYVEESVDNHISRAFSSFKNNHDLTDEQLKFLDRAEKQINKAGYDSIDIRRMFEEIPIFGQSYGSYQRVDETMFDGKLDEYVSWLNETFADNTEREPVYVAPQDYVYDPDNEIPTTAKAKYNANVEAIRTLITLEKENRNATPEEQTVLARYSGWGGIPQAFDSNNIVWRNEYNELKELLSESEYSAARATTLSSFYSPPEVVDGVYQALDQFHFLEGNVLEPSMGIGNFFAKIPSDLKDYTQLYGVEIDSISGRIAKKLYPSARIQIKGFEETKYNDNSFDVVIGNVPFGNVKIHDRRYDKLHLPMHDYFAAKAVDQVKPGGIVAFVTSKYTMDKKDTTARKYLAERAELLGAVRLPAGTFKDTDNTTTDILFFKKRNKIDVVNVPEWVYVDENSEGIAYNRYFHENPDMMLGNMAWDERMRGKYGEDSKVTICLPDESDTRTLGKKISEAVSKIEGTISVAKYEEENKLADMIPADPDVKNFTYTLIDGELYYRENELMRKCEETGKQRDRIIGMHKIRQAEIALVNAESNGCSDNEMTRLQRELNDVYDKFVKAYGYVTDNVNQRAFSDDDDVTTVAALEIHGENDEVIKAPIFFKRTINPPVIITRVDTAEEALQVSLDRLGRVDIEYMSTIYGNTPEVLIEQLGDMIYRDPTKIKDDEPFSGYVDKSEYLSGNVVKKLDIAKAFANNDSTYNKNVAALEGVLPERISAEEISVRLGSPWIEAADYNRFYQSYTGLSTSNSWDNHVARLATGEYKWIDSKTSYSNAATEIYGTSRMNSFEIFERLLNQREIIVKDAVEDEEGKIRYVPNDKETRFAKEKARQMEQAFKDWIWSDIDRREHYEEIYNRSFNCIVGRDYDGSHQHFDGMNPNLALYSHQKDAVMRAKLSGNTLLAHEVGAGKTFEMITIVQEKKRLGLINKACVTVPKALTEQMGAEWKRLYPSANVLVATANDFTKANRKKFFARCATGDYDAIIMSHEQFGKISMSIDYQEHFIRSQLAALEESIVGAERYSRDSRASVKALERQKKNFEAKLKKLLDSPRDTTLSFEQLGFDYLVVDEAHNFKNCFVNTKMGNIAGVQTTSSMKATDMLMKCDYLNERYDCHNILFATGTPNASPYQH